MIHPHPRRSRGFTLVELLVVIGIIALLISILLPALNKAREQANTAKCAANMRSAVQALQIYVTESKGWMPGPNTSGALWRSSGAQIGGTDVSSDETPTQKMDWVSPTFGKTFRWPENDYKRLLEMFNVQLKCPSNPMTFDAVFPTNTLGYKSGDLTYASYGAVLQFHVFPAKDGKDPGDGKGKLPPMLKDAYAPTTGGLEAPPGYAPMITKVGPAASKVFLVEGGRYVDAAGATSFNLIRYQIEGGNFMVGGPFSQPKVGSPFFLPTGPGGYTSNVLPSLAKNYAWRHRGKMNLAFFDGHVEARTPADSIAVKLYVPKGTKIITASNTYDPNDTDGQIVD